MPVAAISTSSFGRTDGAPLERLRRAGFEPRLNPHGRRLERDELLELVGDAEGLIAGTETLDRELLTAVPALKVVSRCGSGLDNVDLAAAAELGIAVRNTPEAPAAAVAELALAGMLDLLRRISAADRELRAGRWHKPTGRLLAGKVVGLVGLGRVGKRLVELLAPFGVTLLASDPRPDAAFAERHGVRYAGLSELLAAADVVSLHAAPAPGSGRLLDGERLALLKPSALLVNTARGGLVDEAALYHLLAAGKLGGAFLDVFEEEPYGGPLAELPATVLTPHIGSYAAETRVRMEMEAVENMIAVLTGGAQP